MRIGPLEYIIIGLQDGQFTSTILPELHKLQKIGHIRVVDLIFVSKAADGEVTTREVSELSDQELAVYENMADDLLGLLTVQDVEHLAGQMPQSGLAVIVLLEHTWALGLTEAVRKAGGALFAGGMITHEALHQLGEGLAAINEESHA